MKQNTGEGTDKPFEVSDIRWAGGMLVDQELVNEARAVIGLFLEQGGTPQDFANVSYAANIPRVFVFGEGEDLIVAEYAPEWESYILFGFQLSVPRDAQTLGSDLEAARAFKRATVYLGSRRS